MPSHSSLACVLFDLDGTLVDTAPDLVACLNHALLQHGFNPVLAAQLKPFISFGATAMIEHSVKSTTSQQMQADILATMLDCYQHNSTQHSQLFAGISKVLTTIESLNLKWGIVTNKSQRFTQSLVTALALTDRVACVISGDSTGNRKPHPEPLFAACSRAQVKPEACVYIGDAAHDIVAGNNAGMKTLAAVYGYLKPDDTPATWGADALIESPQQLITWLQATCP